MPDLNIDLTDLYANTQRRVRNAFPTVVTDYRIAIIGEAPGAEEDQCGIPFSGASGRLLTALLSKCGILRSACFIGNICQVRPPNNDITAFAYDGEEIQSGLEQLRKDLYAFNPNVILLLGSTALRAFNPNAFSISDYRGTLFTASDSSPAPSKKCLSSFHPAAVLRTHDWMPLLSFDLQRTLNEGHTKELILPTRAIRYGLTAFEIIEELRQIRKEFNEGLRTRPIGFDIEGGIKGIPCLSLSKSPEEAIVITFSRGAESLYSEYDEREIWRELSEFLFDPLVKKAMQNLLYENFVLPFAFKILVRGWTDDTMVKHWELYAELQKSLAFQISIYTKEPFYKDDRKHPDPITFWNYSGKDACCTDEINSILDSCLTDAARNHYVFNLAMLHVLTYMQLRGFAYDEPKRKARLVELRAKASQLQIEIDKLVPVYYGPWSKTKTPRKLQDVNINVDSSKQMCRYLYEDRGFQVITNHKSKRPTADEEALLSIGKRTGDATILKMLELRQMLTRISMLQWKLGRDARMRCGYNLVGTETGRLACYTASDDTGGNAQTVTEADRDLYIPDPGCVIFQCDLSGADGWTVAAHCYALNDPTMLLDLKFGIKIAKVIALMFLKGPQVSRLPREELIEACKEIPKDHDIYFGSKCCQHGSNYGMQKVLLSKTIFKKSEGKVSISASDSERLQKFYFIRYPGVLEWHKKIARQLSQNPVITDCAGHTRKFFGRPGDHDTLKAALSHEPQANTTYITNLATLNLWRDAENRNRDGSLRIEPLHSVHDALVGQFKSNDLAWALPRIKSYFNNTVTIANQSLVIPFEGRYGSSWGTLEHAI